MSVCLFRLQAPQGQDPYCNLFFLVYSPCNSIASGNQSFSKREERKTDFAGNINSRKIELRGTGFRILSEVTIAPVSCIINAYFVQNFNGPGLAGSPVFTVKPGP